jgi:hypothetical protein
MRCPGMRGSTHKKHRAKARRCGWGWCWTWQLLQGGTDAAQRRACWEVAAGGSLYLDWRVPGRQVLR